MPLLFPLFDFFENLQYIIASVNSETRGPMDRSAMQTKVQKIFNFLKTDPLAGGTVLLLLTAAVHGLALFWGGILERDSVTYITAAVRWADTGEYIVPHFPPLPCFIIKSFYQMGLPPEVAGRAFSFLCSLPLPFVAYSFAMKAAGSRPLARYGAFMTVFHPLLLSVSAFPMRDSIYVLLAGLVMVAGIEALKKPSFRAWSLCALWTGAALCCRVETLEFFLLFPLLVFVRVLQKAYPLKKGFCCLLFYWFCAGAVWFLLVWGTGGRACLEAQYENYIKGKLILLRERWNV